MHEPYIVAASVHYAECVSNISHKWRGLGHYELAQKPRTIKLHLQIRRFLVWQPSTTAPASKGAPSSNYNVRTVLEKQKLIVQAVDSSIRRRSADSYSPKSTSLDKFSVFQFAHIVPAFQEGCFQNRGARRACLAVQL